MRRVLRRVDPHRPRGRVYRAYARFSATPLGRWFSRHVAWKLDPYLLALTRGRLSSGGMLLPVGLLRTTGARSGAPRRNAVIYFHDGADVIVVASYLGAPRHPSWFHNVRAHPEVTLNDEPLRAEVVPDAERDRLWALADRVFPPFADYRRRAAPREIPIVRLTPLR